MDIAGSGQLMSGRHTFGKSSSSRLIGQPDCSFSNSDRGIFERNVIKPGRRPAVFVSPAGHKTEQPPQSAKRFRRRLDEIHRAPYGKHWSNRSVRVPVLSFATTRSSLRSMFMSDAAIDDGFKPPVRYSNGALKTPPLSFNRMLTECLL